MKTISNILYPNSGGTGNIDLICGKPSGQNFSKLSATRTSGSFGALGFSLGNPIFLENKPILESIYDGNLGMDLQTSGTLAEPLRLLGFHLAYEGNSFDIEPAESINYLYGRAVVTRYVAKCDLLQYGFTVIRRTYTNSVTIASGVYYLDVTTFSEWSGRSVLKYTVLGYALTTSGLVAINFTYEGPIGSCDRLGILHGYLVKVYEQTPLDYV